MKKVLFVYYSQAGQTARASQDFADGLAAVATCDFVRIESEEVFAFPWRMTNFFRAFPRCVLGLAPAVKLSAQVDWDQYDLIVIGYQVWFLSPSLPIQGFFKSPLAQQGLTGKKVVLLATCRNLWFSARDKMQQLLAECRADLRGQITLCEISPLWASFVTTPRWMLTGKKEAFAFFPPAGIADQDFQKLREKARRFAEAWKNNPGQIPTSEFGSNLNRLSLRILNRVGIRFFRAWASLIHFLAPREGIAQDIFLLFFRLNLAALIVILTPCAKLIELCMEEHP